MDPIKVLIVDDEPPARNVIKHFLKEYPFVKSISEAKSGPDALNKIEEDVPDLIFLDIQMPEMNGFDFLRELIPSYNPLIVFTTAYDKYAIQAFEYNAFDYLLKPFDYARFNITMERLISEYKSKAMYKETMIDLLDYYERNRPDKYLSRIAVKVKKKYIMIKAEDIMCFEGAGNYVNIHCLDGSHHLVYKSLGNFESSLDPGLFIRVNRSAIINKEYLKEMQPYFSGEWIITLRGGKKIKLSRSYKSKLSNLLGDNI